MYLILDFGLDLVGYGLFGSDVAEYLYKKKPQIDSLVNFLCNDLTDACSTKPPPVPKVTKILSPVVISYFKY